MLQVVVALPFLLAGLSALVSAGQYLAARDAAAMVAASAARAAAQPDPGSIRSGGPTPVEVRVAAAESVAAADGPAERGVGLGRWRTVVIVDGAGSVTVIVTATVDYGLPSFGMPTSVEGSASSIAVEAVRG